MGLSVRSPRRRSIPAGRLWLASVLPALLCCSGLPLGAAEGLVVEGVRIGSHEQRTRLVLDLSAPADYRLFRLENPARVVVDIRDASLLNPIADTALSGTPILRLRSSLRNLSDLRIVIDLAEEGLGVKRFQLPPQESAGRGHRLVIDLLAPVLIAGADIDPEDSSAEPQRHDDSEAGGETPAPQKASPGAADTPPLDSAEESQALPLIALESRAAPESGAQEPGAMPGPESEFANLLGEDFALSGRSPRIEGYLETSTAYTFAQPEHWSKLRARLELTTSGSLGESVKYKLGLRFDGDGAYALEDDFYPKAVRDDQLFQAQIREFYVDFGGGAWAHRVGRQHIVWGEMVGLFLADVVSARDTREFYLQDFEAMRIPQWAWNAQYFAADSTFELVYIPYQSVDNIGEPGADFYPFPLPADTKVWDQRPERGLENFNWGVRASTLLSGWSLSGYFYDSVSVAPTLVVDDVAGTMAQSRQFSLQYDDLKQVGGTFSKDFGRLVFKGEAVYVDERRFQSFDPADPAALLTSAALDWVIGATIPVGDWRWDLQVYGRKTFDHDRLMGFDESEYGVTALVNYAASSRLEYEFLALAGLNRKDYLLRPKIAWRFARDWRLQMGADIFAGDEIGLFGPYESRDRVYLELKRWF